MEITVTCFKKTTLYVHMCIYTSSAALLPFKGSKIKPPQYFPNVCPQYLVLNGILAWPSSFRDLELPI